MTWNEFKEKVDTKLAELAADGSEHGGSEELAYISFDRTNGLDDVALSFSIEDGIIVLEIEQQMSLD